MSDLTEQVSANLLDFYRYVAVKTGIPHGQEQFLWVRNDDGKWPKWVIGQDFDLAAFDIRAQETIARMKDHELPAYWNLLPGKEQGRLRTILENNGFREIYRWTGMWYDMTCHEPREHSIPGLVIKEVSAHEDLSSFVSVINHTILEASRMEMSLAEKLLGEERFRMVIGIYGGEVVSVSALFISGDIAGIYFVATLEEARNKGIGSAVTGKCLDIAACNGVKKVILHASRMGEPVYRRLGFKAVENCFYNIYWLVGRDYR